MHVLCQPDTHVRCSLAVQHMCSPERLTPFSGGNEVEGKRVRSRAASGVCEVRPTTGKVAAGLLLLVPVVMEGAVSILWPGLPFLVDFLLSQTPQIRCGSVALGPEWERPACRSRQCGGCTRRQREVPALSPGVGGFRTLNSRTTCSQGEKRL